MFYPLLRPLFFRLPPEQAHALALRALASSAHGPWRPWQNAQMPQAPRECLGLRFPNAVGLAAGFDKDGAYIDALGMLGFGHIEVGTVTPRPQSGNPRPRLFRLPAARALINRMGFNNAGVDALVRNLAGRRYPGIVGVNIGKNRDTPLDRANEDYCHCLHKVYPQADYVAVNISSPNTPGLRELQHAQALAPMLAQLKANQAELAQRHARYVPLLVKVAPDLPADDIETMARIIREAGIDGVIATNTTLSRAAVAGLPHADEAGGLSGQPLRELATATLARFRQALGEAIPLIGVGGIMSAADAQAKLNAGAQLIQVYTGMIYEGPNLIRQVAVSLPDSEPPEAISRSKRSPLAGF